MKKVILITVLLIVLVLINSNNTKENFKTTSKTTSKKTSKETSFDGKLHLHDLYFHEPDKDGLFTHGDSNKKTDAVFTFVPDDKYNFYDGRLMYNGKQVYYRYKYTKINGKTSDDNSLTINDLGTDNVVYYKQIGYSDSYRLYSNYVEIYFYSSKFGILTRNNTSNYHSSFTIEKV